MNYGTSKIEDRCYLIEEIPLLTGYDISEVKEAVRSGEIKCIKIGVNTLRVFGPYLREWVENKSVPPKGEPPRGVTSLEVSEILRSYGKKIYLGESNKEPIEKPYGTDSDYFRKYPESSLVDLVCTNIHQIEAGMEVKQREYRLSYGNAVDILAIDVFGTKCLIEVKKNPTDIRLVAQCIDYPADFSERVRMITVSPYYPDRILRHLRQLGYVEMYQFGYKKTTGRKKKSDLYLSLSEVGYLIKT